VFESVLLNCTFERGSLSPTYKKPFDLFARATETGEWQAVWGDSHNWLTSTFAVCASVDDLRSSG